MMRASLCAAACALVVAGSAAANDAQHPTVVELYQSQGCSSCPPAIAQVNTLADRPDVLVLTFAVTYWDQLGWKDTFARPEFTARQWDYAHGGGRGQVATPQTIVNGRAVTNGGNRAALIQTIRQADRGTTGPVLNVADGKVSVGAGNAVAPATIWLVRYDARTLQVPIRAGENGGKTIAHRNVVRSLTALGTWRGTPVSVALPASGDPNVHQAVIVQTSNGGPILAAARA